jgi:glycine C-acetyltransferase
MPMPFLQDEVDDLRKRGVFTEQRVLNSPQLPTSVIDGNEVINMSSNNYLGLATHPKLKKAMIEATEKWGAGAGAVRPIIGTNEIHIELEKRLAEFKGTESCLVFVAGIAANRGTIQALLSNKQDEDAVISDQLNHASIIDGVRLTKAKRFIFNHCDMADLEAKLKEAQGHRRIMVITDGVFSMDGDIAPLDEIAKLAKEYNAFTFADDAHASGVLGPNGRGTVSHFVEQGKMKYEDWDIQMGTLSKGLGCLGGYICGTKNLTDHLRHAARPFLFSTAHPPGVAAACIAALDVVMEEPELIEKLWENTEFFKKGLQDLGFDTGRSETPIAPIIVGDEAKTMEFMRKLYDAGIMGVGIVFPTVPRGAARVRTIVTATHTRDELQKALDIFEKIGKEMEII